MVQRFAKETICEVSVHVLMLVLGEVNAAPENLRALFARKCFFYVPPPNVQKLVCVEWNVMSPPSVPGEAYKAR